MNEKKDIRWIQRFSNYKKALAQLELFSQKSNLSKMEEQGLIKAFEYTYELAWNTMKDFYEQQGEANLQGSRDTIRMAFKRGLIADGNQWMNMIESRIKTAHTYNSAIATEIVSLILKIYLPLFLSLKLSLEIHE